MCNIGSKYFMHIRDHNKLDNIWRLQKWGRHGTTVWTTFDSHWKNMKGWIDTRKLPLLCLSKLQKTSLTWRDRDILQTRYPQESILTSLNKWNIEPLWKPSETLEKTDREITNWQSRDADHIGQNTERKTNKTKTTT